MTLKLDDRQRAMLQEMHVLVWLPPSAAPPVALAAHAQPAQRVAPKSVPASPSPLGQLSGLGAMDWPDLAQAASACQACGLCAGRKNTTLVTPHITQADWLIVGDTPDEDEDRSGQAFVEQSGQLLDNMLKAVGASRQLAAGQALRTAYVTDVVKCRPPQGRNPQPDELAQCAQYLQREIALVQPKVILAMGRFAIQTLLSEQPELAAQPLGKLRGTVYRYRGTPVVVTYHPKVLLRASSDKAKAWADLCLAMDVVQA